jgi:VCBS repeat-containing protein
MRRRQRLLTVTLGVTNGVLTLSGTTGLAFSQGDGTGDATMTFTGTAADINAALEGLVFAPVADYNGPALLTITTNDNGNNGSGGALSDLDTVAITVAPVVDITDDLVNTDEDTAITFHVIAGTNGATPDNFEGVPVLSAINGTSVTAGSMVDVGDGTVTVDATTGLITFQPDADFHGDVTFTYTVTSPAGVTEMASVTVQVAPVNDDPVPVGTISDRSNDDSDVVSVDVSGFFDDVDVADVLTYSATNLPTGLTIDPATGVISGTIDSSASVGGPYNVIITADDGNGGTTTQSFVWSVSNPLPTAVDDEYNATQNDSAIVVGNAITNNDTDPDGDVLSAIVQSDVAGSNGGLFSIDSNGNVTFDPNGDFADLLGGETRQTTFSYTIEDADGATSTATVTVTVLGVNEPPVPVSGKIEVSIGSRGGKLGLSAPVDPDGDPLTITVSQLPKKGILRLANGNAGESRAGAHGQTIGIAGLRCPGPIHGQEAGQVPLFRERRPIRLDCPGRHHDRQKQ